MNKSLSKMMDNCYAPQWRDFESSSQLSYESYFDVEHAVHKSPSCFKENPEASVTLTKFEDSLETEQDDPTNAKAFFIPVDNKRPKESVPKKEEKPKSSNLYHTWNIPADNVKSGTKTISIPQRLKAAAEEMKRKMNLRAKMSEKPDKKVTLKNNQMEANRMQASQRRRSNVFNDKQTQNKVLTCQYRRRSLLKYRRCSNKFVSMAEAVSKFHSGTPQRFRTISRKDLQSRAISKSKRSPLKLTTAVSPEFRCKKRARTARVMSQKDREERELEEMKKHQIKAKPVPIGILKAPSALKMVAKKPVTIPCEFRLTQVKRNHHDTKKSSRSRSVSPVARAEKKQDNVSSRTRSNSCYTSKPKDEKSTAIITRSVSASTVCKVLNVPKITVTLATSVTDDSTEEKDEKKVAAPIVRSVSANNLNKDRNRKTIRPITRSTSASAVRKDGNKNGGISRTVSASSIPKDVKSVPNSLQTSFEARNKEFQQKREEKLKSLQMQEIQKLKTSFHARPIPKFSKLTNPETARKRSVLPCPFSFAERDKNLAKKKEQLVNQIKEKSNKVPVFHATPLPNFKPVTVHNVKNKEKKEKKNPVDQENKQPNIIEKKENEGNSEDKKKLTLRRTTRKKDFEENLKKREQEMKMKKEQEEKEKMMKEKAEIAELRRKTEVKARPMPVYKPITVAKSNTNRRTTAKDTIMPSKSRLTTA